MTLFSKRYAKPLGDRRLRVSLPRRLRQRIWYALEEFNFEYWYQPDPTDDWSQHTDLLQQLEFALKREYGQESLVAYSEEGDERGPSDLKSFILRGWPWEVLDAVEHYATLVEDADHKGAQRGFQREINRIMQEEYAPWLLSDGTFVQIDSDFIAEQMAATEDALNASGFPGALAELRDARADLTAGDVKGAIVEACKSYESALKTLLGTESGNASTLGRRLREEGFLNDLPGPVRAAVVEQVLMTLPTLRNRLGGHGQGEVVVDVPRRYGELAISLAASFVMFCVDLQNSQEAPPDWPGGETGTGSQERPI